METVTAVGILLQCLSEAFEWVIWSRITAHLGIWSRDEASWWKGRDCDATPRSPGDDDAASHDLCGRRLRCCPLPVSSIVFLSANVQLRVGQSFQAAPCTPRTAATKGNTDSHTNHKLVIKIRHFLYFLGFHKGKTGCQIDMKKKEWGKRRSNTSDNWDWGERYPESWDNEKEMGNAWRECKGYTPTWIPCPTEIDKTGIDIGKTPPWEEEGAGEKPEEEILEEREHSTSPPSDYVCTLH